METIFKFINIDVENAVRYNRFYSPGFPHSDPYVGQSGGLERSHDSFSAVGTIHLTAWVCGRTGFMRILKPLNRYDPASRSFVPTALAADEAHLDPGLHHRYPLGKSGVTPGMAWP